MAFRTSFCEEDSAMFEGYCQADGVTRGRSLSGNIPKVLFLLEGSRWRRDNETTTDKKLKEQKHKSHISYTTRITEEI